MRRDEIKSYYEALRAVDIGRVASEAPELSGRLKRRTEALLQYDCPRHASISKLSFHVHVHEGRFRCWGCGVGGDAIQLVEFLRFGTVTKGRRGAMPQTHREARDHVAAMLGMQPLARAGMSAEDLAAAESEQAEAESAFAALTDLSDFMHAALMENAEAVEWCRKQWGFDREALKRHRIGYAEKRGQWECLMAAGHSERVACATGAFHVSTHDDRAIPFFRDRIVFPYFSGGRCVYMIGRRTPWTEKNEFEHAKYKKLPVFSEKRPGISPAIDNRVLFGEDVLASSPQRVVITEGITDAIAAQDAGFACLSPVTVRIAKDDMRRIVDGVKRAGVKTVYLVEDVELSGIGEAAALETARALEDHGIRCLVATLPLGPDQTAARDEFVKLIGEAAHERVRRAEPSRRRKEVETALQGDEARVARAMDLMEAAKIDLCIFFREKTPEDFEAVLGSAREPVEVAIDAAAIAPGASDTEKMRSLEPLLREIGKARPATRDAAVKRLADRIGIALSTLKSEASEAGRRARRADKAAASQASQIGGLDDDAAPGATKQTGPSCKDVIRAELDAAAAARSMPNWGAIADVVYAWLGKHGARFYRAPGGEPLMLWEDELYSMRGEAAGPRARYEGLLWRLAGVSPTSPGERRFCAVLGALASDRGQPYQPFGWVKTDHEAATVYVANGHHDARRIVRMSPEGVEIVPNGEAVFLRPSAKLVPISYEPGDGDDDPWLDDELHRLLISRMACPKDHARFLVEWLCSSFLLEFSGTRPAVRLTGEQSSGKSWTAKMFTALAFGDDQQKKATNAANWADSCANQLLALDQLEMADVGPELIQFLLTAVTGISREKRAAGTESGVTVERPTCVILTTGVEPLGGELQEVMSRSIIVEFDRSMQAGDLLERSAIEEIKRARPRLLSAIFRRIARVLAMIRDEDGHARAIRAVRTRLGDHDRRRCDEYLALMWLFRVAGMTKAERAGAIDNLDPVFARTVESVNAAARDTTRDASPIVLCMVGLFGLLSKDSEFRSNSDIRFAAQFDGGAATIEGARTDELYLALRAAARARGFDFPYKSPVQFGVRFGMAIPHLQERGFTVQSERDRARSKVWTIRYQRTAVDQSVIDGFNGPAGVDPVADIHF